MEDNNLKYAPLRDVLRLRGESFSDVDDYLLLKILEPSEQEERELQVVRQLYGCGTTLLLGVVVCVALALLF